MCHHELQGSHQVMTLTQKFLFLYYLVVTEFNTTNTTSLKSSQEIAENIFRLTTKQLTDNILWCTGLNILWCTGLTQVSHKGVDEVLSSELMHTITCLMGIYSFAMFLNSYLLRQNMQFCKQKKSDSKLVRHFRYAFIGKWGQIIHLLQ